MFAMILAATLEVWPGFDMEKIPLALYDGERTVLRQERRQAAVLGKLRHEDVPWPPAADVHERVEHLDDVRHAAEELAEIGLAVPGADRRGVDELDATGRGVAGADDAPQRAMRRPEPAAADDLADLVLHEALQRRSPGRVPCARDDRRRRHERGGERVWPGTGRRRATGRRHAATIIARDRLARQSHPAKM